MPLLFSPAAVYAPKLTGFAVGDVATADISLSAHIARVTDLTRTNRMCDVILVGHSYGDMVIEGVAEHVPARLCELVFLDACIP